MELLLYIFLGFILLFTGIVFYGAPYVPTHREQVEVALDLLDLSPGQTLLELGVGDGRVANAAAKRGIRVVGYELNPVLFAVSYITTFRNRKLITIKWRNYLHARWPSAQGIFIFAGDRYMKRLDTKITRCAPGAKVASFAFEIKTNKLLAEEKGVYLYQYGLAKDPITR